MYLSAIIAGLVIGMICNSNDSCISNIPTQRKMNGKFLLFQIYSIRQMKNNKNITGKA
jgi:hypothetical protein